MFSGSSNPIALARILCDITGYGKIKMVASKIRNIIDWHIYQLVNKIATTFERNLMISRSGTMRDWSEHCPTSGYIEKQGWWPGTGNKYEITPTSHERVYLSFHAI